MTLAQRAAATAQVVVSDLGAPELSPDDFHHLSKVLRLRPKETVVATDGAGSYRFCIWDDGLVIDGDVLFEAQLLPRITVGFALTKGDKPELVVQKLTEIGVDVIRPLIAAHTIVRWDAEKRANNLERLRRVGYEAAMQSRRVWLPEVTEIVELSQLTAPVLAQAGGVPITLDTPEVFVGPEGGWSESELVTASALVDLGPTILRAETAAISVGVQLAAERSKRTFHP